MRIFIFTFILLLFSCTDSATENSSSKTSTMSNTQKKTLDWQGHRGARGLRPENTIPAFLKALEYPISTLELDVAISKDGEVIVTHEPWFNHAISSHPDGKPVTEAEEKELLIYQMTYEEIKKYDVGLRGNPRFPDQVAMAATKPSLADMVKAVDEYCEKNGRDKPNFDIEVKSEPSYYDTKTPQPKEYVSIVLQAVKDTGIKGRSNLQSFDLNVLEEINRQDSNTVVAYLIDNFTNTDSPNANLEKLTFQPDIYSPYFLSLTKEIVDAMHEKNIKVIPWTVNEKEQMIRMMEFGVDGIITDYPNFIEEVMAQK